MAPREITHGFGVPNRMNPHQFLVEIPKSRIENVEISEDFGAAALGTGVQKLNRAVIPRRVWTKVAPGLQSYLKRRLKEKQIRVSRFSTGENRIERILGREICVLAWAIEDATPEEAVIALLRWSSYRPEEMWWLFLQIDRDGGEWDSPRSGWRGAIKQALIRGEDIVSATARKPRPKISDPTPDLFGKN